VGGMIVITLINERLRWDQPCWWWCGFDNMSINLNYKFMCFSCIIYHLPVLPVLCLKVSSVGEVPYLSTANASDLSDTLGCYVVSRIT
jgi:hypothetical protein